MASRRKRTTFRIYATRESIDNSERNSLHWCIFALAIMYSIPGTERISVDKTETRFTYKSNRYIFPTPPKSAAIAASYDSGVLSKRDIEPWQDVLANPISVEPIRHQRKSKARKARAPAKKAKVCTPTRSTRWNGRKIR